MHYPSATHIKEGCVQQEIDAKREGETPNQVIKIK